MNVPAVPLLVRITMSSVLMIIANGLASAAGWITPEIDVPHSPDLGGDCL